MNMHLMQHNADWNERETRAKQDLQPSAATRTCARCGGDPRWPRRMAGWSITQHRPPSRICATIYVSMASCPVANQEAAAQLKREMVHRSFRSNAQVRYQNGGTRQIASDQITSEPVLNAFINGTPTGIQRGSTICGWRFRCTTNNSPSLISIFCKTLTHACTADLAVRFSFLLLPAKKWMS